MKRRRLLQAVAAIGILASCSSSSSDPDTTPPATTMNDDRPPTPPEWDRAVTRPDETAAAAKRTACGFQRGALADESLGATLPTGKDIPIETIVVLMQENRSFDHYFGRFAHYAGRTDVESATEANSNPESLDGGAGDGGAGDGGAPPASHPWHHAEHLCFSDTNHEWDGSHTQYDDGKMNGFVVTNQGTGPLEVGDRAMGYYDERDIPFYYGLAKAFALGDQYHCALLGPTWPNRMFLLAGTSFGVTTGNFPDLSGSPFPDKDAVIFDELEKRHVDWMLYTSGGPPGTSVVVGPSIGTRWNRPVVGTVDEFTMAAAAGKLPPVSYVDMNFLTEGNYGSEDEHPPGDIQIGQKLVASVIKTLMASPQWPHLALFLTYDEHGGTYDHVPPPNACVPDGTPPMDSKGNKLPGAFDRLGFRVPLTVVSPYAKRGYVSHAVLDHTSILRFIEAKFRVPALTSRDANAMAPYDFFDFASPPRLDLPVLPEPVIDPTELSYCEKTFPKK